MVKMGRAHARRRKRRVCVCGQMRDVRGGAGVCVCGVWRVVVGARCPGMGREGEGDAIRGMKVHTVQGWGAWRVGGAFLLTATLKGDGNHGGLRGVSVAQASTAKLGPLIWGHGTTQRPALLLGAATYAMGPHPINRTRSQATLAYERDAAIH